MRKKIEVDDRGMIELMRRGTDRRLEKMAAELEQLQPVNSKNTTNVNRIANTVLSPGLKLVMKQATGDMSAGSLWVVADPSTCDQTVGVGQVMLVHDVGDRSKTIVIPVNTLDDKFELR